MTEAINDAMAQGGTQPADIDYINAHGSGTKQNDRHETSAYKQALGEQAYKIPISSIKSMIGHSLGAIGAIEMAACALAIDRGVVPPTANCENPDPECDLDYTPSEARQATVQRGALDRQRLRRVPVGDGLRAARGATGGLGVSPDGSRAERPEPGRAERPLVTLPDHRAARRVHRHRRGGPERQGHRRPGGRRPRRARAGSTASPTSIRPSYDTQLAGEVTDFDVDDYIERRLQVQTDHWTHMALAATQMAFDDASFEPFEHDPYSMSVITASSSGGNEFGQREIQALWGKGPGFVGAYQSIAWFYAATSGQISIRHNLMGAVRSRRGRGRRRARGAPALPAHDPPRHRHDRERRVRGAHRAVRADLPDGDRRPERRSRTRPPPTARSTGARTATCPGREGRSCWWRARTRPRSGACPGLRRGGGLRGHERRVPSLEAGARRRAARPGDPHRPRRRRRSVPTTWTSSSRTPPACPRRTRRRRSAIKEVFGKRASEVPVTAPKTMVGRLYAGGAPLDVATALLAMRDGVIPPTINLDEPAEGCDLSFVTGSSRRRPSCARRSCSPAASAASTARWSCAATDLGVARVRGRHAHRGVPRGGDRAEPGARGRAAVRGARSRRAPMTAATSMRFREFPTGAVICREGDAGKSMFVLVEGLAYALVALPEEPELRTRSVFAEGRLASKLRRGDVIGAMSLITGEPQPATVKAAVPTSAALELREDDFRTLIAKSPRVLANLTRILSGELAVTTRRHAQRGHRGEAVALIAGPSLAPAIPDILAATAAASAKPVRSLDARESVEDALEELDEALLEHGTVVLVAALGQESLGLVAEHVDRAVVVLGGGRGGDAPGLGGDGAAGRAGAGRRRGPRRGARRPGRRSSGASPTTATRWPASRRTTWRGSAGTSRGPSSAWRSAPAAPRGTRTSGRSRCSRRPDTSWTAWGARASARSWAPTWRSGWARPRSTAPCAMRSRRTRSPTSSASRCPGTAPDSRRSPEIFRETTAERSFDDTLIPLVCMAVDLTEGTSAPLREGPIWEALLASTAVPGMFPPHEREGHRLVDGVALVPVPTGARGRGRRGHHGLREPDEPGDASARGRARRLRRRRRRSRDRGC